jgi:hypothetical protein
MPAPCELPGAPDRSAPELVREQAATLLSDSGLLSALEASPIPVMIVNPQRQIVFANGCLVELVGAASSEELCGLRPGEVLGCAHSTETDLGCGTSVSCSACGALRALNAAQLGAARTETCRMVCRTESGQECLELEVSAAPLSVAGRQYVIAFASSVRDRVRNQWIEFRLLPDIGEISRELAALAACLGRATDPVLLAKAGAALKPVAERLYTLVRTHGNLLAAEGGRLHVVRLPVSSLDLMRECVTELRVHPLARDREICIDPESVGISFVSDATLIREILAVFLLNAQEAAAPGHRVTLRSERAAGSVQFSVHHDGVMSREAQLQVFNPGFSTKGPGRGFGTWSALLIAERFLNGSVSFESDEQRGTVFVLRLPAPDGDSA